MGVQGPLFIDVMAMCHVAIMTIGHKTMLTGEGQMTRSVDTRADHSSIMTMTIETINWVTGHLVDGVTVVTIIMYRDGPACAATHRGGNCWKIKSKFIPEKSVGPVNSCVSFHVVSQIWIQFSMRNVSEDEDDGTTSRLKDIMKSRPHVVARPLMDYVVVGQDDNCPLAVVRCFAN